MGVGEIYGCGCKEVYRFPHTTYPYSSCICSFLQQCIYIQSLNSVEGLYLTDDNIQYHTTFIASGVSSQGREINIKAGNSSIY